MVDYDVIVVGGGPAGATAARRASLAGLNVLLIDKAKFPRYKPCAGAIRGPVIETLDIDLTSVLQKRVSGFSIFAPSGFRVDCIPEDRSHPGYTVMREEFDHLLLRKAVFHRHLSGYLSRNQGPLRRLQYVWAPSSRVFRK